MRRRVGGVGHGHLRSKTDGVAARKQAPGAGSGNEAERFRSACAGIVPRLDQSIVTTLRNLWRQVVVQIGIQSGYERHYEKKDEDPSDEGPHDGPLSPATERFRYFSASQSMAGRLRPSRSGTGTT